MILLKTTEQIELMRRANQVVAETLLLLEEKLAPGISTDDLDRLAEGYIRKNKCKPAFKGYRGYPASLCTSVNEQVVHGIPSRHTVLKEGDIIGIDCGVIYEGFYGDHAKTLPVGLIDEESQRLLRVTRESLYKGIEQIKQGNRIHDISWAVQEHAESAGFSVVRDFVGHGIGQALHEEPQIPNFGKPHTGLRLQVGMVLAIEPMINMGKKDVKILDDGWTAVTVDGMRSAHFEHSIALTDQGFDILSEV